MILTTISIWFAGVFVIGSLLAFFSGKYANLHESLDDIGGMAIIGITFWPLIIPLSVAIVIVIASFTMFFRLGKMFRKEKAITQREIKSPELMRVFRK